MTPSSPLFPGSGTQSALLDALDRWLAEAWPFEARAARLARPDGMQALWQGLAQLGVPGAALPEHLGGLGEPDGGLAVHLLILHRLGPALSSEPYLGTAVIGAGLLQRCGGAQAPPHRAALAQQQLALLVDGRCRIALAAFEPHSRHHLDRVHSRITRQGAGWRLDGRKTLVAGAPGATHLIVSAREASGGSVTGADAGADVDALNLLWLPVDAPGVQQRALRTVDGQWAAEVAFDNVTVPDDAVLARGAPALAQLQQAVDEATLATGAEAVGIMQRLMRDTVAYARQRQQFGVPIASFQALQHRLADMHCACVQAQALVVATLAAMADPAQTHGPAAARARGQAVASAQLAVARACQAVGQGAVQIHGGMGMTDELWIGHGFKRLTMIERQFGTAEAQLQRLAQALDPA